MISALLELQGKNEATQRKEDTVDTLIDAEKVVEGAVMGCESLVPAASEALLSCCPPNTSVVQLSLDFIL